MQTPQINASAFTLSIEIAVSFSERQMTAAQSPWEGRSRTYMPLVLPKAPMTSAAHSLSPERSSLSVCASRPKSRSLSL